MASRPLAGPLGVTHFEDRREYERGQLDESSVNADPFRQFASWIDEATGSTLVDEPYAMTLATASADGRPSARVVLLREVDPDGFTFYTNYDSRKGRDLSVNPFAALVFYWGPLERQIRIEGSVSRTSPGGSDAYFNSRPRNSRLGALVSEQSAVIAGRQALEERLAGLIDRYPEGTEVPRPQNWGGYRLTPEVFEFWQGRRSRLHDRIVYRRSPTGWTIERLSP